MCDVALIYPPITFSGDKRENLDAHIYPLGLLYLASILEKAGYSVIILDIADGRTSLDDLIKHIDLKKPCLVGISAMTSNIRGATVTAKQLKRHFGDSITICIGGSHVSADPSFIHRFPYFDIAVTGEGEITFLQVAKNVLSGKKIKGVFRGETPQNLDCIPFPARHLIDINRYKRKGAERSTLIASRGCPYACSFCSRPALSKKVRWRSPQNVVDEMKRIYSDFNGEFVFYDDTMTISRERTLQLCNEIIAQEFSPTWDAITRIDLLDEFLLRRMKEAGCEKLLLGVESGSERVRNEIVHKKLSNRQIEEGVQLCKKTGIKPVLFFMLGFPTETKKDIEETCKMVSKLAPSEVGIHLTWPMPGSEIFEIAIKEGTIPPDVIDKFVNGELGEGFRGKWPYYIPPTSTITDLIKARKKTYLEFYFAPRFLAHRLLESIKSWKAMKKNIQEAISLLIHGRSMNG